MLAFNLGYLIFCIIYQFLCINYFAHCMHHNPHTEFTFDRFPYPLYKLKKLYKSLCEITLKKDSKIKEHAFKSKLNL